MVVQAETPNAGGIVTAPIEQGIAAALQSMRRASAEAYAKGRDDFYDVWTAEVMDQTPTIFVAVQLPGETMAWLIDPSDSEGALEVFISHRCDFLDAEGTLRSDTPPAATLTAPLTRLLASLADDVSWLVREQSGQHLSEYGGWRPETD